jgi:hypothetical protein
MKKTLTLVGLLVIICTAGFFWLLSGTSPDNAPSEDVVVDVTDQHFGQ